MPWNGLKKNCSGWALSLWWLLSFSSGKFSSIISLITFPLSDLFSLNLLLVHHWIDSIMFSSFLFYFPSFPTLSSSIYIEYFIYITIYFSRALSCHFPSHLIFVLWPLFCLLDNNNELQFLKFFLLAFSVFPPEPFHFCLYFLYHVGGIHQMFSYSWVAIHI